MITACILNNDDSLNLQEISGFPARLPQNVIWLDVFQPSDEERDWLESTFVDEVPDEDEMDDIESSSRFRVSPNGVHILSLFPQRVADDAHGVNMSFNIRRNMLLSVREEDVSIVRLFRHYIRSRTAEPRSAMDVLLYLHELKVDQLSDLIEDAYGTLEETVAGITREELVDETLHRLIEQEEMNSQVLLSLYDTRRALRFIRKTFESQLDNHHKRHIDELLNDIESILPHTQFLANKIEFQLSVSMGYTNHKQNKIIKIFSVAAVVFMPPTWIASVYGMNFKVMPELDWLFGYPVSIGMMILSAACTYLFFRKKGWL